MKFVDIEIKGYGSIRLELDDAASPKTVENFVAYVKSGFYDGLIFHRVISNFMIQGGGFEPGMKQKHPTAKEIENEAGLSRLKNSKYTVAMARTNAPHSANSQFFINVADNNFLNHTNPSGGGWGYCVFGKVVHGFDVVDKIAMVKTGNKGPYGDVPQEDIIIEKAVLAEQSDVVASPVVAAKEVSKLDQLTERFLAWPVPADCFPDGTPGQPGRTGTNLLSHAQAKEMLTFVLEGEKL